MPSGAKKRKAAKKKQQKVANNGSHSHQGVDDAKSHDERSSDGGEVEREENVVSNRGGSGKEVSLGEGDVVREEKVEVEGFNDVSVDGQDVARELENGDHKSSSSSSSSSSDDDEVAVEKEEPAVVESEEVDQQGEGAASEVVEPAEDVTEEVFAENSVIPEVVEKSVEESIPSEELVKKVVSLSQESATVTESVPVENLSTSDVIESELKENVDEVLPLVEEKSNVSPAALSLLQEKIVEKVISVQDGVSGNSSESVNITARDDEALLPQSSGVKAIDRYSENDSVKESETHKYVEEQPLISSAPVPVRRTSWMNCCGLFDVLSGGSSR